MFDDEKEEEDLKEDLEEVSKARENPYTSSSDFMPSVPPQQMGDYYQNEEKKSIVEQLLKDDQIQTFVRFLKGESEVYDERIKRVVWKKIGEPLMNEKGITAVMRPLTSSLCNVNTWCSGFDDETIRVWIIHCSNTIIDLIYKRYKEFEIDKSNMSMIVLSCESIIKSSLYRARCGLTVGTIEKMNQMRELQTFNQVTQPVEKKSLLSRVGVNPFGLFRNQNAQ